MMKLVDFIMTRLFKLAEYVCGKISSVAEETATSQEVAPIIRFSSEDQMTEDEII